MSIITKRDRFISKLYNFSTKVSTNKAQKSMINFLTTFYQSIKPAKTTFILHQIKTFFITKQLKTTEVIPFIVAKLQKICFIRCLVSSISVIQAWYCPTIICKLTAFSRLSLYHLLVKIYKHFCATSFFNLTIKLCQLAPHHSRCYLGLSVSAQPHRLRVVSPLSMRCHHLTTISCFS